MHTYHALGLHMHQPPDNLKLLIRAESWEATQIIKCYERAARYAHIYKDAARFHIGFSGVLLEQFLDPAIIKGYRHIVDIPEMIKAYRGAENIELIGMGYFHPIFPLIPVEDWEEQISLSIELMERLFGRRPKGFWPPEMAFCMEMIPYLKRVGYEYVVVDSVHVEPEKEKDIYTPYICSFEGAEIIVIPRDRDISNAQESGLDPNWFKNEVMHKVGVSSGKDLPRLVTTWSDGENGGWFRQMDEIAGFFGHFFAPYMELVRHGRMGIQPITISQFLRENPPKERATVRTGAWNVGSTSGYDFSQWAGSESQKRAIDEIFKLSGRYWALRQKKADVKGPLSKARSLILSAETSCFLFWGEAWIPKLYERTKAAWELLDQVEAG